MVYDPLIHVRASDTFVYMLFLSLVSLLSLLFHGLWGAVVPVYLAFLIELLFMTKVAFAFEPFCFPLYYAPLPAPLCFHNTSFFLELYLYLRFCGFGPIKIASFICLFPCEKEGRRRPERVYRVNGYLKGVGKYAIGVAGLSAV